MIEGFYDEVSFLERNPIAEFFKSATSDGAAAKAFLELDKKLRNTPKDKVSIM